jgi:hypothetical protein
MLGRDNAVKCHPAVRPQETAMDPYPTAEFVIPLSKGKVALAVLGSVAFVGASIWIWSIADTLPWHPRLSMKGIALAGASFFGLCGVYACIKVFEIAGQRFITIEAFREHKGAGGANG